MNVRSRASLYQALERLMRHGLVEVRETVRSEGYPDRVVYGITDAGRETAEEWLREMLRTTGNEYPDFIAAVSVLFGLAPDDVRTQLAQRAERLAAELAQTEAHLHREPRPAAALPPRGGVPAGGAGGRARVGALASSPTSHAGRLTWTEEWLRGARRPSIDPTEATRRHEQ